MVPQIRYHLPYPVLLKSLHDSIARGDFFFDAVRLFGHLHITRALKCLQGNFSISLLHTNTHETQSMTKKNKTADSLNNSLRLFLSGLNWPCVKMMPFNSLQNCSTIRYKGSSEYMWLQIEHTRTHTYTHCSLDSFFPIKETATTSRSLSVYVSAAFR